MCCHLATTNLRGRQWHALGGQVRAGKAQFQNGTIFQLPIKEVIKAGETHRTYDLGDKAVGDQDDDLALVLFGNVLQAKGYTFNNLCDRLSASRCTMP